MLPATCFIEIRPMPALWQASRARFIASSWAIQGLFWSMMASTNPPSTAAWRISGRRGWWVENPTNFALPDLRIASAASLNSLLRGHSTSVAKSWSPRAWMKIRST